MNKTDLEKLIGKYIQIVFTLYSKKTKATGHFDLLGYISTVEDKMVEFHDNYNHDFIIPIARIKSVALEGERRTEEEAKKLPVIKPKRVVKQKEPDNEPQLMMVDYSTGTAIVKPINN